MKKFVAIVLALVLGLGLTACGGKNNYAVWNADHAQAILDGGAFSEELEELDADIAFNLYKLADYGLDREKLKEATVHRSAGATCEEPC